MLTAEPCIHVTTQGIRACVEPWNGVLVFGIRTLHCSCHLWRAAVGMRMPTSKNIELLREMEFFSPMQLQEVEVVVKTV
jgi:hypothetical protein